MPRRGGPIPLVAGLLLWVAAAGCTEGGTSISATRATGVDTTTTQAPRGNADGVLKIGALLPTSGGAASLGVPLLNGVRLAVAQINEAGGVNGRPVQLVEADEGNEPASAGAALARLIEQDRVDAVIGPVSTRATLALLGTITQAQVLTCSPTNSASSLSEYPDDGYFFRTAPPDSLQAVGLGREIADTGARSTAIVYADDEYGRLLSEELRRSLEDQGNAVVSQVAIDPSETDLSQPLTDADNQSPDAFAYAGTSEPGARVVATLRTTVGRRQVPIFVTDGMRQGDVASRLGQAGTAVLDGVQGLSIAPSPASAQWFRDLYAGVTQNAPASYAGYAYDCANLIALGALLAATDNPSALRTSVIDVSRGGAVCRDFPTCNEQLAQGRNIDLDGASGPIELDDGGDPTFGNFERFRFDANGVAMTLAPVPVRVG